MTDETTAQKDPTDGAITRLCDTAQRLDKVFGGVVIGRDVGLALNEAFRNGQRAPKPYVAPAGGRQYALRYAKAQEFYGFVTPAAVLLSVADFDNEHRNTVYQVSLRYDADSNKYGATALWEDC